ncbi:GNAT family N-acetyltransferase [Streptomyces capparidis]
MPTTEITVRHHDAHEAPAVRPALVVIYAGMLEEGLRVPRSATVERFAEVPRAHTAIPGWSCVIAYHGEEPVGCGYGWPLPADTDWWDGLLTPAPADVKAETGSRTLQFRELMLRRAWRGTGTGRRLFDNLLGAYDVERAVCATSAGRPRLHAYYTACGGRSLGDYRAPGSTAPPNTAFLFPLPLPPTPA